MLLLHVLGLDHGLYLAGQCSDESRVSAAVTIAVVGKGGGGLGILAFFTSINNSIFIKTRKGLMHMNRSSECTEGNHSMIPTSVHDL